jgi:hypothetical protein
MTRASSISFFAILSSIQTYLWHIGEHVTKAWLGSSVSLAGGSEHDDQIWVHQIRMSLEMTFSPCGGNVTSPTLYQM